MKLARTTFFVITSDLGRRGRTSRQLHRSNLTRVVDDRRPPNQLTARWHVCRQTGRLECAWSLEATLSEGQCRYITQTPRPHLLHRAAVRPWPRQRPPADRSPVTFSQRQRPLK
jgi:hypothetical protein